MGKKRLSKLLLVILNITYFLAAVAILTIGSLSLSGSPVFIDLLDLIESTTLIQNILDIQELTLAPAIYLVCLGSVAVILAFVGYCEGCGWVIFVVCKFCIVLFNVALIMYNCIVPFHGKDNVQNLMLDNLKLNYETTTIGSGSDPVILPMSNTSAYYWATMEFNEACCAAGNYADYAEVLNSSAVADNTVSASCCIQKEQYKVPKLSDELVEAGICTTSAPEYINSRGCIDYVMSIILTYRQIFILTAAVFIALEVLTIVLTVRIQVL